VEAYALPGTVPTAQTNVNTDAALLGLREPMPEVKGVVLAGSDLGCNKVCLSPRGAALEAPGFAEVFKSDEAPKERAALIARICAVSSSPSRDTSSRYELSRERVLKLPLGISCWRATLMHCNF
jgi:hypothetical protein